MSNLRERMMSKTADLRSAKDIELDREQPKASPPRTAPGMAGALAAAQQRVAELEKAGAQSAQIGNEQMPDRVRWIRSYVVNEPDGRIGTFCIYEAKDGAAIREHARRVGMPGEEFYPVATTVVVRPDPVPAEAV